MRSKGSWKANAIDWEYRRNEKMRKKYEAQREREAKEKGEKSEK